ncbi:transcriptional regulator BetI [Rhodovibrionaceae bacterium A322]
MAEVDKSSGSGRTAIREVRRQQLIEATMESIARRGFAETTLQSVTKGANLSHGVVNFHFKTKEALYAATLGALAQEHYDHWSRALKRAGSDPAKKLAAVVGVDFKQSICSPKKLAVWFAFWGQAKHRPAYLEIHNTYDNDRSAVLEELCQQIIADGGYKDLNAAACARKIVALIDGLWLKLLLYPGGTHRQEARNDCLSFLAGIFPQHFSEPPPS